MYYASHVYVRMRLIRLYNCMIIWLGQRISGHILDIVLIGIPITLQCVLNFSLAYLVGYTCCIPHDKLAPAAMIATR